MTSFCFYVAELFDGFIVEILVEGTTHVSPSVSICCRGHGPPHSNPKTEFPNVNLTKMLDRVYLQIVQHYQVRSVDGFDDLDWSKKRLRHLRALTYHYIWLNVCRKDQSQP